MELLVAGKKHHILEQWVSRWQFLTSYREETHSDTVIWPYTSEEDKKEIELWLLLNRQRDESVASSESWLSRTAVAHGTTVPDRIKSSSFYKTLLYMDLVEPSLLEILDIDSDTPIEVREVLYRQLGRWIRQGGRTSHSNVAGQVPSNLCRTGRDMFTVLNMADPLDLVEYKRLPEELQEDVRVILLEFPYDILRGVLALGSRTEEKAIDLLWNRINWSDVAHFCVNNCTIDAYRSAFQQLESHIASLPAHTRSILTPSIDEVTPEEEMALLSLTYRDGVKKHDSFDLLVALGRHSPFMSNHIAFMTEKSCPNPCARSTRLIVEVESALLDPDTSLIVQKIIRQAWMCSPRNAPQRLDEYFIPYNAATTRTRQVPFSRSLGSIVAMAILTYIQKNEGTMYDVVRVIARTIGLEYLRAIHHLIELGLRRYHSSHWKTCYDLIDGIITNPEPDMVESFTRWP